LTEPILQVFISKFYSSLLHGSKFLCSGILHINFEITWKRLNYGAIKSTQDSFLQDMYTSGIRSVAFTNVYFYYVVQWPNSIQLQSRNQLKVSMTLQVTVHSYFLQARTIILPHAVEADTAAACA
jgi:hypothetical protein